MAALHSIRYCLLDAFPGLKLGRRNVFILTSTKAYKPEEVLMVSNMAQFLISGSLPWTN